MEDISDGQCESRLRTSASIAFDRQELEAGGIMYQSVYREENWAGDLIAACVDGYGEKTTCMCKDISGQPVVCSDPLVPESPEIRWSADHLAAAVDGAIGSDPADGWWNRRKVITYSGAAQSGIGFTYDALDDEQRAWLRHDPDLVRYLRGDRSLEPERFRARSSYYGDFINFVPVSYSSISARRGQ